MKVDKIRSYIAFGIRSVQLIHLFLNEVLTAAIENKNLQFQYESKSGIKQNMFILSVYMLMTDYGTYHPMTSVEKVLLYRVDRILSILSTEKMKVHS